MEKSAGWSIDGSEVGRKLAAKVVLSKKAFMSLPGGVPMALSPEVSESKARPVPLPITVTLSQ